MANETDKIYDHAFIYMLTINEECYIGSTFDFNRRMSDHKSNCFNEKRREYNCKLYTYIRDHGGWNNVNISIIDVYYLVTKKIKIETEQYYMNYFQSSLNSERAFTGIESGLNKKEYQKQYYEGNKETKIQRSKKYYEDNKEQICNKRNEKIKCQCGMILTRNSLYRHKETIIHKRLMTNKNDF